MQGTCDVWWWDHLHKGLLLARDSVVGICFEEAFLFPPGVPSGLDLLGMVVRQHGILLTILLFTFWRVIWDKGGGLFRFSFCLLLLGRRLARIGLILLSFLVLGSHVSLAGLLSRENGASAR